MENCEVVIVNYNAGNLLTSAVRSALGSGARKIVVVDNSSTDDSIAMLLNSVAHSGELEVVRNSTNLGFAVACNQGLGLTSADTILFLNPDSELTPGALSSLLAVLNSAPDVGMAGGLICNPDGSEDLAGRRRFPTLQSAIRQALDWRSLWKPVGFGSPSRPADFESAPTTPMEVEAISGACMLVKRTALEQVGSWDEGYFLHCEDLDWCMRFRIAGWKVMFVPGARVNHARGACSRTRPIFVEWHKHKGMARFYTKFYRSGHSMGMAALVSVGIWSRFLAVSGCRLAGRWLTKWQVARG